MMPEQEQVVVSDRTWELLRRPGTATLTTVMAKQGLWNTFLTGVKPLAAGTRMAGQAFTLRYIPAREDLDGSLVFDNREAYCRSSPPPSRG